MSRGVGDIKAHEGGGLFVLLRWPSITRKLKSDELTINSKTNPLLKHCLLYFRLDGFLLFRILY